jgi:hypothetical protein
MTSNRWCFTLNNYTAEEQQQYKDLVQNDGVLALYVAKEVGSSGTPHLQGIISFKKTKRLSGVKTVLGTRAHVEKMFGTWNQAKTYCQKEGSEEFIDHDNRKQGKRTDIDDLKAAIVSNESEATIADDHFGAWARYPNVVKRFRFLQPGPNWRDVTTRLLYGTTGVGKTSAVHRYAMLYDKDAPADIIDITGGATPQTSDTSITEKLFTVHSDGQWWDGYDGQPIILFDDFYGQIKISKMLRLLDGYPLQLPIKGGFVWAQWTRIFFTSNVHHDEWWPTASIPDEVREALRRRITRVHHITQRF